MVDCCHPYNLYNLPNNKYYRVFQKQRIKIITNNKNLKKMEERIYKTNYKVATKWCNNNYVMCNNITEIDSSVIDNMRFELDYESGDEIYQWFISDCNESDVEFLEENFGLRFSYSDLLDCYVLCVDHHGTSWDYVAVHTSCECAERELGEDK